MKSLRSIAAAGFWALVLGAAVGTSTAAAGDPVLLLPKAALTARDLAVIVNDRDPLSVTIGAYYQRKRAIPARNVIHVSFAADHDVMPVDEFKKIETRLKRVTPRRVQAYALTWRRPYRVGCMSVTSAFAMGYDKSYCAEGCRTTARSPYFDSDSSAPFTDFSLRPAMSIAAATLRDAKALIERGVASDGTRPHGTGYLVQTKDGQRNVRAVRYDAVRRAFSGVIRLRRIEAPYIEYRNDVLFYFIGAKRVPKISTNRFLPGAVADALTSTGGMLTDSSQMSSLRWLQGGATGSYGTVVEPCNYPGKFSDPGVLIGRYLQGETLIEAYWKSVAMPGQGIFIGEPLARPFGGYAVTESKGRYTLRTYSLQPGEYVVVAADNMVGPYSLVARGSVVGVGEQRITFPDTGKAVYALVGRKDITPSGITIGDTRIALGRSPATGEQRARALPAQGGEDHGQADIR